MIIDVFSVEKISNDDNVDDTMSVPCMEKRKVRRTWRMCFGLILLIDLLVCLLLFGVWLFVCQGFECLAK